MVLPKPLNNGARVALIAPSGPVPPGRLEPAVASIRAAGLEPVVYPGCRMKQGYLAGPDSQRAGDINAAFCDDTIDGILCIRGGYGAHRLMKLLDFGAISRKPKRFCGYSDVTALHIELNQRCGMVTWHTPMPATEWYNGLDDYTAGSLRSALFGPMPTHLENPPGLPLRCLSEGSARGRLTGGNLSLIVSTIGTFYEIDTSGKILFIEEIGEEPYRIDRMLLQLKHAGKLAACAGIILGAFTGCDPAEPDRSLTLDEVFAALLPKGKPAAAGLQCGHILPTMSLPLGVCVELNAAGKIITIME